jgi:outer membrane protein assembly factor BamB
MLRAQTQLRFLLFRSGILLAALSAWGCASRNIHREAGENTSVLQRQWTWATREGLPDAGERGFEFSNAAVFENTLIFGSRTQGVLAVYPSIQRKRWAFQVPQGVVSPILVDRGSVYFGGGDGKLYSLSAETGKVNWTYDLRINFVSKPTVDSGRIFVTTGDDTIYAFDAGTGKWLWHYRRRSSPPSTIVGASQPTVDNGEVIVGLSDGYLVAVSVQDGQLKWEKRIQQGTKFTDVDARVVISGSTLYVPAYDGSLVALRRQGSEILWRWDGGGTRQVILEGGRIYHASNDGVIHCIEKDTSKPIWKFELDKGAPTAMADLGEWLAFGSSHQYLYIVQKSDGKLIYRYNVGWGSGFAGSPLWDPATRNLYLLSQGGNLMAWKAASR